MKSRRHLQNIVNDLRHWAEESGLSHEQIGSRAGVNQSTVSRSLQLPGPRNFGPGLMRLCKIAGVSILVDEPTAGSRIDAALARLRDGSDAQDEAIAALLDAVLAVRARNLRPARR